jgi:hypothetical protein
MIDEPWNLEKHGPGEKLDLRVQRLLGQAAKSSVSTRQTAPFLPFERGVYALVVAVYAMYAGACALQLFQDARATHLPQPEASQVSAAAAGVHRWNDT